MKKLLVLIILCSGCLSFSLSAQDMRSIFLNAPDEIFPLLTKSYRADLVDYIDAGMTAKVTNRLDGTSVLEELECDYLRLATTASSVMQLKLLPLKNDTIICVVKSVKAEALDSRIYFYDKAWNMLAGEGMFRFPSVSDFFVSQSAADAHIDICDIYLVSLSLSAADKTLVVEYTMPAYMGIDDAKKVKPLLRKLIYVWDGARFVID